VPKADRQFYAAAYARDDGMRAGFEYFKNFEQDEKDFAELSTTKLNMVFLVLTGEKASGTFLIDVRGHRQKVESCSALFLALWLSLGYLQASRAGINAGESANPWDLQSAAGDYFSDWFMTAQLWLNSTNLHDSQHPRDL
jgi:hypothetical protein